MERKRAKVLIGIISKNRATILPKAINSALAQNYEPKEIKIFDDNSIDNTKDLKDNYQAVQWHFSPLNKGYLYARNKLMKETDADYYCSLDDDSWFLATNELEIAIEYLEKNKHVAGIAFNILSPDQPNKLKENLPPKATNIFIGCGHVLRISSVKEVGFYEKNIGFYGGEEKDLSLKLLNKGYELIFFPNLYIWHDKTTIARNQKKQHLSGVCNDLVFAYRRTPFILLLPVILIKTYKHLIFSITYKEENLMLSGLKGIFIFYKNLLFFKLKRQPVRLSVFKKYNDFNA